MKDVSEFIRASVRPLVTYILVAASVYLIMEKVAVPEWFQTVVAMSIAYWFADRSQRRQAP